MAESRDLVRRLLAALIVHGESHPDDDAVVRVYYLDGQQEVRDVRANVRTSRLDLVLSGDLSELFARDGRALVALARIRARAIAAYRGER